MISGQPLRFWLAAACVGAAAAFMAAVVVAAALGLAVGVEQVAQRGLAALNPWNAAKGLALVSLYLAFFALFALPYGLVAVPMSYAAAFRVAGRGEPKHVFVTFSLIFGVAGPMALEMGLNLAGYLVGVSPRVHAFTLSPVLSAFGLFAAPVTALAIWPILRRLEGRLGMGAPQGFKEMKA
jgi:hypothetical protein